MDSSWISIIFVFLLRFYFISLQSIRFFSDTYFLALSLSFSVSNTSLLRSIFVPPRWCTASFRLFSKQYIWLLHTTLIQIIRFFSSRLSVFFRFGSETRFGWIPKMNVCSLRRIEMHKLIYKYFVFRLFLSAVFICGKLIEKIEKQTSHQNLYLTDGGPNSNHAEE